MSQRAGYWALPKRSQPVTVSRNYRRSRGSLQWWRTAILLIVGRATVPVPGPRDQRSSVTFRPTAQALLRRPAALALQSAVLVALVGGTTAWSLTEKTVSLSVDGTVRSVTTHGGTVRDVLADAGVSLRAHDVVTPSADSAVSDGTRVAYRHSRLLTLDVDGSQRQVWVTAASVSEALDQLGVRADGAVLSASRSREIPLSGLRLEIRLPKAVSILVDGHVLSLTTTALTVRDALIEAGVKLRPSDRLTASRATLVTDHLTVRITRVDGHWVTESFPIAYATERRPDASMYQGDETVLVAGRPGVLVRTFVIGFLDGKFHSKLMSKEVRASEPVTEVIAYGTKDRPASPDSVQGADGLNWGALARCESGGNPRSVSSNGAYRGLYQFSMGTWHGVGGQGDPIDASPSEQTYRAKLLYRRDGRAPWPVCGKYL